MRRLKFKEAILEGTCEAMNSDPTIYFMGQGVSSPKAIYGTALGLKKLFGPKRVMDIPLSENALTGIATGTALAGMRPILVFQRVDFFLRALDQLINNTAKWNYISAGMLKVPLVIRLIIGRGWGQGPQHSQSLQSFFVHIPGLKVVMPSNPSDAKGLLLSAIKDNNPTLFLEHHWLYDTFGNVSKQPFEVPIGKAKTIQEGLDMTMVSSSYMTLETIKAAEILKQDNISPEIIDLRSLKPFDKETIIKSVRKTGRLMVIDCDWKTCGFASEIIATITEESFSDLKVAPVRITYPDRNNPTSWSLANHFYPTAKMIAMEAFRLMRHTSKTQYLLEKLLEYRNSSPLDVPDPSLQGPY